MAEEDPNKPKAEAGNGTQPAESFEASGAPAQIVPDVDPAHPAVDIDPRAGTTAEQNRIDFNDPTLSGAEAVERALKAGRPDAGEPEKAAPKKGKK